MRQDTPGSTQSRSSAASDVYKRKCKRGAEWAMARASEYQKRAFRLNYEAQAKDIAKVIKDFPEATPPVAQRMCGDGLSWPLGLAHRRQA